MKQTNSETDGTAYDLQSGALSQYNNEACDAHIVIELCRHVTILDCDNAANYSGNWRGNADAERS